ncbi:MAG: hypothetical protein IKC46_02230 [Lachnospiraceae bacterium]|nr:hypothetical protein [Lachnospiraceae bacterium]
MKVIELSAQVKENGIIYLPLKDLEEMGIKIGDEVTISYISSPECRINEIKEFGIEKKCPRKFEEANI